MYVFDSKCAIGSPLYIVSSPIISSVLGKAEVVQNRPCESQGSIIPMYSDGNPSNETLI